CIARTLTYLQKTTMTSKDKTPSPMDLDRFPCRIRETPENKCVPFVQTPVIVFPHPSLRLFPRIRDLNLLLCHQKFDAFASKCENWHAHRNNSTTRLNTPLTMPGPDTLTPASWA